MISVGSQIPNIELQTMQNGKVQKVSMHDLLKGKKSILFAVPGAFTPTCSEQHLPGYLGHLFDFRRKGIDQILCVSVNDAFVMNAWAKDQNIQNEIIMLADGSAEFTKAIGMDMDMYKFGFGIRSRRYAMMIDDLEVKILHAEKKGGELDLSKAENMLEAL